MEEELISKKDLLQLTGISYGALYRWKRKQLIPEEWFIKKSMFTGQETFFPKDKILERIHKIQEMKEDLSLDDLAEVFSEKPMEIQTTIQEMIDKGIVTEACQNIRGLTLEKDIDFYGALYIVICDKLMSQGLIHLTEAEMIKEQLTEQYRDFKEPPIICVYRKKGICFCLLTTQESVIQVDKEARTIATVSAKALSDDLKSNWGRNEYA